MAQLHITERNAAIVISAFAAHNDQTCNFSDSEIC